MEVLICIPYWFGAHGSAVGSRHYATSQKVVGSIPNVTGFFNLPDPSSSTIVLGLTQTLTEMSTRTFPGDKR
jgi:hypothetical protein